MTTQAIRIGVFAIVVVLLAVGGVRAGDLEDDPNAYSGWSGRVEFRGEMMGLWWAADVEYCVYAPGDFTVSWPGAVDPSAGQHFVYAYQIFNDLGIDPEYPYPGDPPSTIFGKDKEHVTTLTVGINGPGKEAANDSYIAGSGDKSPTVHSINPTSVLWEFMGAAGADQVNYGDVSDVLFFTSPRAPGWDSATLSGEVPDEGELPSPTPEPAALILLVTGGLVLLRRRSE